jgi:hypothetical protein
LTRQDIYSIFHNEPLWFRVYNAKVPEQMSEEEFWTMYFTRKFYEKKTGLKSASSSSSNHELLGGPDLRAFKRTGNFLERERLEVPVDRDVDLTSAEAHGGLEDYVEQLSLIDAKKRRKPKQRQMEKDFQEINRHASLLIRSLSNKKDRSVWAAVEGTEASAPLGEQIKLKELLNPPENSKSTFQPLKIKMGKGGVAVSTTDPHVSKGKEETKTSGEVEGEARQVDAAEVRRNCEEEARLGRPRVAVVAVVVAVVAVEAAKGRQKRQRRHRGCM